MVVSPAWQGLFSQGLWSTCWFLNPPFSLLAC